MCSNLRGLRFEIGGSSEIDVLQDHTGVSGLSYFAGFRTSHNFDGSVGLNLQKRQNFGVFQF
jgi:hypothetical protein